MSIEHDRNAVEIQNPGWVQSQTNQTLAVSSWLSTGFTRVFDEDNLRETGTNGRGLALCFTAIED